jgi:hypothetical protein
MKQLTRDFGKIIAVIGIFILVTDICGCNAHANEYQKFYLLNNELYDEDNYALSDTALVAKVLPNKIEFYQNTSSTNYQWASIPQMDFELHGKYDYLFCGDLDGICIMIVNKGIISIYLFDGTIGR